MCDVGAMDDNTILCKLKTCPEELGWSKPQSLVLQRNDKAHLGVIINTYKSPRGGSDTFTVITRVKDECLQQDRGKLGVGFRIIKICKNKIVQWNFPRVVEYLQELQISGKRKVKFKVCQPEWKSLPGSLQSNPPRMNTNKPLRTLSLPVTYSNRSSQHSGSLTPVENIEMPFPRTLRHKDGVSKIEGFTSLDSAASNDEYVKLINEAISHPWRIRWSEHTKMVEIKKHGKYQHKIGLKYKFKKKSEDGYCVVESVECDGPAHLVLRPGDLIHSVNQNAIVDENTLKNQIQKSTDDRIKLCIQSPKEMLGNPSIDESETPPAPSQITTPLYSLQPEDIHIRGPSVGSQNSKPSHTPHHGPNGTVRKVLREVTAKPKQVAAAGVKPFRPKLSHTEDDIGSRRSASIHMASHQKGHRRNLSDSSSTYFKQQMTVMNKQCTNDFNRKLRNSSPVEIKNQLANSSLVSCRLENTLVKWSDNLYSKHIDHCPYVRFVQMSTSGSYSLQIHKMLAQIVNIEKNLDQCNMPHKHTYRGRYALSTELNPLDNMYKTYSIEDLLIAKHGASYLKEQKFVLQNLSSCSKLLCKSKDRLERLIGKFLEHPPEVDEHFVDIESLALNFDEVCAPEYSTLFTENCLIVITVDIAKLANESELETEIGRIRVCLNHIRMFCKSTHVYFVTDNRDIDIDLEQEAANQILELEKSLKQICACGLGKLKIRHNSTTDLPLFNLSSHCSDLRNKIFNSVKQIVNPLGMGKKFPLLALKLNQEIEREMTLFPVITRTHLCEMLRKSCPDLEQMNEVMTFLVSSLHSAGKWINPSQIHHTTMHSYNLKMLESFILHRPQHLIQCVSSVRAQSRRSLLSEDELSEPLADKVLLAYMHLFHVVEQTANEQYRFVPNAPTPECSNGSLNGRGTETVLMDFDGFLPRYLVNYLFCELAVRFMAAQFTVELEFIDEQTVVLFVPHLHTSAQIHIDCYKCVASIRTQGPEGSTICGIFRQCLPQWLVAFADQERKDFIGFRNSYETLCERGIETPVRELPIDLLRMISEDLHPSKSPLGNDVRLLAEKLLNRTLSQLECTDPSAAVRVLEKWVQLAPGATFQNLLQVLRDDLTRHDIHQNIRNWMTQQNLNINIL